MVVRSCSVCVQYALDVALVPRFDGYQPGVTVVGVIIILIHFDMISNDKCRKSIHKVTSESACHHSTQSLEQSEVIRIDEYAVSLHRI